MEIGPSSPDGEATESPSSSSGFESKANESISRICTSGSTPDLYIRGPRICTSGIGLDAERPGKEMDEPSRAIRCVSRDLVDADIATVRQAAEQRPDATLAPVLPVGLEAASPDEVPVRGVTTLAVAPVVEADGDDQELLGRSEVVVEDEGASRLEELVGVLRPLLWHGSTICMDADRPRRLTPARGCCTIRGQGTSPPQKGEGLRSSRSSSFG